MELSSALRLEGEFTFTLLDGRRYPTFRKAAAAARRGDVLEVVRARNLLVTVGLAQLAAAMAYNLAGTQNVALGSPLSSTSAILGDLYGAVGTSNTAAAASDTQLGAESARVLISSISQASNQVVAQFFFGTGVANVTIAEYGVFLKATAAANSGTMLDHSIPGATTTKTNVNSAILALTLTLTSA